jgi:hypothetical protein
MLKKLSSIPNSVGYLVVALLVFASQAAATVLVPADFTEMVTASHAIAHGRVVAVDADPTGNLRTVRTFVTLEVEQYLKGSLGRRVTFSVPGGQVGRYRRMIVGAPHFAEGDEVIVFLSARGPSIPYVFGLSQGVYRVARDGRGGALVTPPIMPSAAERVVRGDPARRPVGFDAFAREIRAALERER